jgi:glutathione synthase/RimK-type ligase-like ATP-grasp enzyme
MKKVKFIFKKIKGFQYKQFFSIINEIHKKTRKSRIIIFFDIVFTALRYGNGYMDYFEFEFYLLNNKERKTYITSYLNNDIVRKYNDKDEMEKFNNKLLFNKMYKKYLRRDFIDLNNATLDEFKDFLKIHNKIICKIPEGTGGKGIQVISINKKTNIDKLYNKLIKDGLILVEEYLVQHEKMNELYDKSVNTLRVITFLDDNGVHILKTILKIGNGGFVDNFSSGGMYTFVDDKGKVFVPAIDEAGNVFDTHPISKTKIVGFEIPNFDEVYDLISKIGKVNDKVRYVGWDIALSQKGPILIEGNPYSGIFQVKPSISGIKTGDLPNYRKYMDI